MDLKNQTQKRTIKFRGKRIDNGEWVYGAFYPIKNENVYFIINNCKSLNFDDDDTTFNGYKVHKKSVGQFTGLFDKNGKEIYEKMELNNTFIIKWLNFRYVLFYISDLTIFKEIFDYENKLEITGEYTEL